MIRTFRFHNLTSHCHHILLSAVILELCSLPLRSDPIHTLAQRGSGRMRLRTCHQLRDTTNFSCSGAPRGTLSVSCHRVQHDSLSPCVGRSLQHWSQARNEDRIRIVAINDNKRHCYRKSFIHFMYFNSVTSHFVDALTSPARSSVFVQAW